MTIVAEHASMTRYSYDSQAGNLGQRTVVINIDNVKPLACDSVDNQLILRWRVKITNSSHRYWRVPPVCCC